MRNILRNARLTPRQLQAQKSKDKIYNTALQLFARHGYEQVKIEDITLAAGMSKGAFYVHFASKDSILLEQYRQCDAHYDKYIAAAGPDRPPTEQLFAFIKYLMDYIRDDMGLEVTSIVYINQLRDNQPFASKYLGDETRSFRVYLRQLIAAGQANGEFRQDIPAQDMERKVVRMMRSVVYDWCFSGGDFDLTAECLRFLKFMLPVLQKPEAN